jgi:hypothetical protein
LFVIGRLIDRDGARKTRMPAASAKNDAGDASVAVRFVGVTVALFRRGRIDIDRPIG